MKIVIRTVTGSSATYEVAPTDAIRDVKNQLAQEYDLPSMRLCHKGKVLDDAKTVAELGFADNEVLIVAGKKVSKAAAPATAPAPAPAATAAPAPAPAPAPAVAPAPAPASTTEPAATTATPASAPQPPAPADDALPPGVDSGAVEFITSMGFPERAAVIYALRCAYGNADRAVEYLVTGIPAHVEAQFQRQQQAQAQQHATPQRAAPTSQPPAQGGGSGSGMTADQLAAMMNEMQRGGAPAATPLSQALSRIPQFEQIRQLVRQNPAALPTVMQQLQQHHPEVFVLVQQNTQEFLDLINAPPSGGQLPPAQMEAGGAGGPADLIPTPADQPAIERLVALGGGQWDAQAAALVYLVCRRNEEVAANVLMDNGGLPPELLQALLEGGAGGEGESDEEQ